VTSDVYNPMSLTDENLPVQLSMFDAMKLLDFTDDRLFASSMDVAERFEKSHENVILDIEALGCSDEFGQLNFHLSQYTASHGRQQPYYKLTRDGFSLLVMGFTGKKAMYWKERYIQAFNMMEAELLKRSIEHAEIRGRSKEVRIVATDAYKEHGASEWYHYSNNTDAIYKIMFGSTAKNLRIARNLPKNSNIRDHLTSQELYHIINIENTITLQLEMRGINNPRDQLVIVKHVAKNYKAMLEAPIPEIHKLVLPVVEDRAG
jgi:Rha family phage regulatory protein